VERITPYLYTASNEPAMLANGKCGKMTYSPTSNWYFKDIVNWNVTQLNLATVPLNDKGMEFNVYSKAQNENGLGDMRFDIVIKSNLTTIY
jgi:hypothetical protein